MADKQLAIKTKDLLAALRILERFLQEHCSEEIALRDVYYWSITEDARYDALNDPGPEQLTLGQLSDDWAQIRMLINGQHSPVNRDLVYLASILLYMGEKLRT